MFLDQISCNCTFVLTPLAIEFGQLKTHRRCSGTHLALYYRLVVFVESDCVRRDSISRTIANDFAAANFDHGEDDASHTKVQVARRPLWNPSITSSRMTDYLLASYRRQDTQLQPLSRLREPPPEEQGFLR